LAFDEYGFGWSDGIPLNNGSASLRYYSNSTGALAFKLSAGYQIDRVYFLLGLGFGNYLYAAHGIGPSAGPSTPTNEVSSPILSWGITAGEDIPLTDHRLYLSPELLFSKNTPTDHPSDNFIPKTISLGFRLNLEWVLFEQYRQKTELEHFIYVEGSVKDCKSTQPLDARITAFEGESNGIVETRSTDTNGHYQFRLKQGRNYRFIVEREGYDPDSVYLLGNSDQDHQLPTTFLRNKISGCAKESSLLVEGNISICGTSKPVRSRVRFIDHISNMTVSQEQTDSAGNYHTSIPHDGTYIIQIEAPGYFPSEDTVELTNSDLADSRIVLKQMFLCDSLNVQSYFDFDRFDLVPEVLPHIDRIAKYLQSDRSIKVTIEGHTDNIGTRNHNMMLSQNRANTLKKYLLTHGVEEDQIASVTGFGPDHPIADNRTESGRQQNRRVNIKVIDRKDQ
jgi:outer membrane protein OmpA-like peptidoglycan-associated protein